jgi:hypothetical protein
VAVVLVAAVGVAAVIILGRGSGQRSPTTPVTGPTFTIDTAAPTTVDPHQAVRAAVLRDYLAASAAYDEAAGLPDGKPPNPDLPAFLAHTAGPELVQARGFIIGMQAAGLTTLGPIPEDHPEVVSVTASTAIVHDCYTSNNHIVDAKTHELRDKPGPVTRGEEATLQLDQASGVWKLVNVVTKAELCPAS